MSYPVQMLPQDMKVEADDVMEEWKGLRYRWLKDFEHHDQLMQNLINRLRQSDSRSANGGGLQETRSTFFQETSNATHSSWVQEQIGTSLDMMEFQSIEGRMAMDERVWGRAAPAAPLDNGHKSSVEGEQPSSRHLIEPPAMISMPKSVVVDELDTTLRSDGNTSTVTPNKSKSEQKRDSLGGKASVADVKTAPDATEGEGSCARRAGMKQSMNSKMLKQLFGCIHWWNEIKEPERTSKLSHLIQNNTFELFTILVVVINCFFTVYEQNWVLSHLGEESPGMFKYVDICFCLFFIVEISMRLWVHKLYFFVTEEASWNIMELFIVAFSTWQLIEDTFMPDSEKGTQLNFLRSLRVLKLTRVLRLLRMVKVFTDLRVIVLAFLNSVTALAWCVVLLTFTIAMFALVFVQVVGDYLQENDRAECVMNEVSDICVFEQLEFHFGSVQRAMLSLYMASTGGENWALYFYSLKSTGSVGGGMFLFYTAFYYFGLFNLLTGMFVDKALRASQPDAELVLIEQRSEEQAYIDSFLGFFSDIVGSDELITEGELKEVLKTESCRIYLGMLGLEPAHTIVVFHALQAVIDPVPVGDFVKGCMRMRGAATSIDLHAVQFEISLIRRSLDVVMESCRELSESRAVEANETRDCPDLCRGVSFQYQAHDNIANQVQACPLPIKGEELNRQEMTSSGSPSQLLI